MWCIEMWVHIERIEVASEESIGRTKQFSTTKDLVNFVIFSLSTPQGEGHVGISRHLHELEGYNAGR